MIARRVVAPLDGTLRPEAALPLQKQLEPVASANPTNRAGISCHRFSRDLTVRPLSYVRALSSRLHPGSRPPVCAGLDPPLLRGAAAVVGDRRVVDDRRDREPGRL